MAIFLLILKIIGIILAVIGSLIAFLLISPITYKTNVKYDKELNVKAKITYLLHIVYANIYYNKEDNLRIIVKVLMFTVYDNKKKKNKKKKRKNIKEDIDYENNNESIDEIEEQEIKEEFIDIEEKVKTKKTKKKKKSFFDKIKSSFINILDKIKKVTVWFDEEHRRLIGFLLENILKILKKIKPKQFKIESTFGTGNVYSTGQILSYLSIIVGMIGFKDCDIEPDFENKILKANIDAKGYFFVLPIIIIAIKIYKNKDFQRFILKKHKDNS